MPWVHKVPKPHRCRKPKPDAPFFRPIFSAKQVGSIWMCPKCKTEWLLAGHIKNIYGAVVEYRWQVNWRITEEVKNIKEDT